MNTAPERPDYRIENFEPADDTVSDDFDSFTLLDDTFVTIAQHHSGDGRDTYLVLFDESADWGVPGSPTFMALHLNRDVEQRSFRFDAARVALVPLAQRWLIQRGCPAEAIEVSHSNAPKPKDDLTQRLEERLKSSGSRYTIRDDYTYSPGRFDFGVETWVLVHDSHPDSAEQPYRIFLEEISADLDSYTLREGAFADEDAAQEWLWNRDTPLPQPVEAMRDTTRRAQVALARSTTGIQVAAIPTAGAAHPTEGKTSRRAR
ncbi:hypothetical protein [Streptantibioticus ferralitis]|uniref:Uncharacterized protein n=1 Tax=Streptantibioticus ferralitis TaxID=236510 RepID=A0ABT5YRY3_9ACTN|nr:hypothetical protein [Streptantibioticus ferralitis]MDF2254351.1 hypothetical protein [Streptantibioticus ferralitis]